MAAPALLFPGQGAQFVGMGAGAREGSAAARAVFDLADEVLGFSLSEIILEGPEERLRATDISQPAILTVGLALSEAAREAGWSGEAAAAAGLSLGEYTALAFAGSLTFADAVSLVHRRGKFMREAGRENPGGMLSLIGLDEDAVCEIAEEASSEGLLRVANLNCPGQIVLSGERPALEAARALSDGRGALKTVMLEVDGAFHSPLMEPAAARLAAALDEVEIRAPQVPFVANVTAEFSRDPGEIRDNLVRQLTSPVLWEASVRRLLSAGVESFAEVGPGRVLTGLLRRIKRKAPVETVGDLEAARALAGAA